MALLLDARLSTRKHGAGAVEGQDSRGLQAGDAGRVPGKKEMGRPYCAAPSPLPKRVGRETN